jgi:predicted nucleic acid-binding protein
VIVVSDSSPLITLSLAHKLDLLIELFGRIVIPRAVYDEVTIGGAGLAGAEEVRDALWIEVYPDPSEPLEELKAACSGLGGG